MNQLRPQGRTGLQRNLWYPSFGRIQRCRRHFGCGESVFCPFPLKVLPDGVCRFSDASFFHQLTSHCGQQVFVGVKRLQTLTGELPFHHERDEHLLAHVANAGLLHRRSVGQELHPNSVFFTDPPRSAARLAQRVERVSRFVEVECWKASEPYYSDRFELVCQVALAASLSVSGLSVCRERITALFAGGLITTSWQGSADRQTLSRRFTQSAQSTFPEAVLSGFIPLRLWVKSASIPRRHRRFRAKSEHLFWLQQQFREGTEDPMIIDLKTALSQLPLPATS